MVERRSTRGDRSSVPTIRELIRVELDAGKSVRDLEADSGYRVKFQTFQELSNRAPKQFPKSPETITGMSAALRCPETTIVLAYARGLGIEVRTVSDFALRLPVGVDDLGNDMKNALVSVVRAAVNQNGASPHVDSSPTTSQQRTQGAENQEVRWEDDAPFRIVEMLSGPDKGQVFIVSASDFADGPPDQAKYRVLQVMDHLPRSTGKSKKQEADAEGSSQSSADELAQRRPPNPPDDAPPTDLADVDAARIEPGHVKQGDRVKHNDEVDQVDDEAGEESQDDDSGDL